MLLTDLQETRGSTLFIFWNLHISLELSGTQTFRLPLVVIECARGTCVKFLPSLHAITSIQAGFTMKIITGFGGLLLLACRPRRVLYGQWCSTVSIMNYM